MSVQSKVLVGLAFAIALISCERTAVVRNTPWPADDVAAAFTIASGPSGLRIDGPIDGARSDAVVRIEPEPEDAVWLLVLRPEDLRTAHRWFDPSRRSELALDRAGTECAGGSFSAGGKTFRGPIPPGAPLYAVDTSSGQLTRAPFEEAPLFKDLGLAVPIDPEPCRGSPEARVLRPFTSEPLLPADALIFGEIRTDARTRSLTSVRRFDDNRVLARSQRVIFLFDKREPYADLEHQRVAVPDGFDIVDFDLDPSDAGRIAAIIRSADRTRTEIQVTRIGGRGLEPLRTATVAVGRVSEIAIDGEGRIIATGGAGLVISSTRGGRFAANSVVANSAVSSPRITADPIRPHMFLSSPGLLFVGSADPDDFRLDRRTPAGGINIEVPAARIRSDSLLELWASALGGLYRSDDLGERWSSLGRPQLPESLRACAQSEECGRLESRERIVDMNFAAGTRVSGLLARRFQCSAMLLMSPSDWCVTPIVVEGLPIEARDEVVNFEIARGFVTAIRQDYATIVELAIDSP